MLKERSILFTMPAEDLPLLRRTTVQQNWNVLQLYGLYNTNFESTLKEDHLLFTLITMPLLGYLLRQTSPPTHALKDRYSYYNYLPLQSSIRKEHLTEI